MVNFWKQVKNKYCGVVVRDESFPTSYGGAQTDQWLWRKLLSRKCATIPTFTLRPNPKIESETMFAKTRRGANNYG
jgi:hypothetical protein